MSTPEPQVHRLRFTAVITREDDRYVAQCQEIDVSSFGDTEKEALAMVTEALELTIEAPVIVLLSGR